MRRALHWCGAPTYRSPALPEGVLRPAPSKRQGPVLWEFRLKGDDVRPRSPKNVGRIRDYYSIPKDGEVPDPVIEGEFCKIESGVAPVIAKLRAGTFTLSDEERSWLAIFIAFQMVRGPAFRDHVEAALGTLGMLMIKAMGRRPEYFARLLREAPGIADEDRTAAGAKELAKLAASAEEHFKVSGTPQASLGMMHIAADFIPHVFTMRWEFDEQVAVTTTHHRRADVALALQPAQKPALFEVAEPSVPSRITEAPPHVGRAGRAGVVLIDFSNDRREA